MKHVFKAIKTDSNNEAEGVWFDADYYTPNKARRQFKNAGKDENGNKLYEYDGQKYSKILFTGTFEDNDMPKSDNDLFGKLLKAWDNNNN